MILANLSASHSGMRLGRKPARTDDLARAPKVSLILGTEPLPEPPPLIDNLSCMSVIDMDGNDQYGDCFYAAVAHLIQAQTALMGKERVFTTDEVLAMYSRDTGFSRDDPATDQGANMYDGLTSLVRKGFCEIQIEGFALVDGTDFAKCHQALWIGGGLLWGVDLALAQQRQIRWREEIGLGDAQNAPGGWGGHAVHQGRSEILPDGLSEETIITWGETKPVAQSFRDNGQVAEVYVMWIKGFVPPIPGFDHARFLAAMKAVQL